MKKLLPLALLLTPLTLHADMLSIPDDDRIRWEGDVGYLEWKDRGTDPFIFSSDEHYRTAAFLEPEGGWAPTDDRARGVSWFRQTIIDGVYFDTFDPHQLDALCGDIHAQLDRELTAGGTGKYLLVSDFPSCDEKPKPPTTPNPVPEPKTITLIMVAVLALAMWKAVR